MIRLVRNLILVLATLGPGAALANTTYTFNGTTYGSLINFPALTHCNLVGGCTNYSTIGESIVGSFTTTTPLPVSVTDQPVTPLAFSFNDGVNNIASLDSAAHFGTFLVTTDASGNVTSATIFVFRWRDGLASGHSVGSIGVLDTSKRVEVIEFRSSGVSQMAENNYVCTTYQAAGDLCTGITPDDFSSEAESAAPPVWSQTPPIPTLWGGALALLAATMAGVGWRLGRQRLI